MTETEQSLESAAGIASKVWKPYPAYKPSGLPWLGDMPTNWHTMPNRSFLRRRKKLVGNRHAEYTLLSLTKAGVIVRDISTGKGKFSSDMGTCQEVHPGDLVFCLFDVPETPRTVGLSAHAGMITGAYTIFECDDPLFTRYIELFYKAMDDRKLLSPLYSGLRNTIPPSTFLGTKSPVPPPEDQDAIARFLAHYDRLVLKYIQGKQKLIALLTEQKQAIIQHAVTRGLNPDVKLKPSGVDWLGEIPGHWEANPARALFTEVKDCGHPHEQMLSVTIKKGVIPQTELLEDSVKKDSSRDEKSAYKLVCVGDIAYNKMRAWQAAFGVSDYRGIISPAYIVMRPKKGVDGKYFHYLLRTPRFAKEAERWSYGIVSDMWSLRPEHFRMIYLPMPGVDEQREISKHIDMAVLDLDRAIGHAEREIALMREYRTRLTADVVTGKIDVREAAAALPTIEDDSPIADTDLEQPRDAEEVLDAD